MLICHKSHTSYIQYLGVCAEPINTHKYERVTKTITAAKERARKTSVTIFGGPVPPDPRPKRSKPYLDYGHDNNNFVIDVTDGASGEMSEVERNVKMRMQKRDAIMR